MSALPDFDELVDWIEDIRNEMWLLVHDRELWRGTRDRLAELFPDESLTWFSSYTRMYVHSTTVRCRKLALDADSRSASLKNLVRRLPLVAAETHAGSVTGWLDQFNGLEEDPAPRQFGGDGNLDEAQLTADLERLETDVRKVHDFASKVVAHLNREPQTIRPTFEELDAAIDRIAELVDSYHLLLRGSMVVTENVLLGPDWKYAFTIPWFGDGMPGSRER